MTHDSLFFLFVRSHIDIVVQEIPGRIGHGIALLFGETRG